MLFFHNNFNFRYEATSIVALINKFTAYFQNFELLLHCFEEKNQYCVDISVGRSYTILPVVYLSFAAQKLPL